MPPVIDTADMKVICGECRGTLEFEVKEGLHGAEVVAKLACYCVGGTSFDWDEGYDDGHADGYRQARREFEPKTPPEKTDVDLSAKPL